MPVYEYSCPRCGVFELMQKVSDPVLLRCPKCKRAVSKLISASSFQFKGTGWYVTDYARKGNGKQPTGTSEAEKSKETAGKAKDSGAKSSKSSGQGAGDQAK